MMQIDALCSACDIHHDRQDWHSLGMICGRCGEHTGNNHQGHYWKLCKKEGRLTEFHFCCPSLPCEYPESGPDKAVT